MMVAMVEMVDSTTRSAAVREWLELLDEHPEGDCALGEVDVLLHPLAEVGVAPRRDQPILLAA